MVRLALFLTAVIVPWLISAHSGHNAVVQKIGGIQQFVPPREGCVAWVTLDASRGCDWCRSMFRQVLGALLKTYHPIEHFYSPKALIDSHYNNKHRDMKGTCFINYLVTDNFKGLKNIFNPEALSTIRTKDWIILVEGEKTSHFLKCWADMIDDKFGFVFPKVVLIMMHNTHKQAEKVIHPIPGTSLQTLNDGLAYSVAVACYMCPEGRPYFVGIQNGESNPYNLLKGDRERKGMKALGPPGITPEPEASYFNARSSLPTTMDEDFFWKTIRSAALQHINYNLTERRRGLFFYTVWSGSDTESYIKLGFSPVKNVFLSNEPESLVYCKAQHSNKYIQALVSPFDLGIWGLLLVTLVAFGLVCGVGFWLGLDVVWVMIGQPPQGKKFGVLVVLASIVLIPLPHFYKEYYSSNAMTPFQHEHLDTNQKAFDSGFRLICSDMAECKENAKRLMSIGTLQLDLKTLDKLFVGPEQFGKTEDNIGPAEVKDEAALLYSRIYKEHTLHEQENLVRDTKCEMVEEYWYVLTTSFQFTGPLSQTMDDTLRILREAGIIDFWNNAYVTSQLRSLQNNLPASKDEENSDEWKWDHEITDLAHMNKTLASLFPIFYTLYVVVILCFMFELLSGKIATRWKRYCERRRYLRAIWHLGKI